MKLQINTDVLKALADQLGAFPAERGGILAEKDGVVTSFYFDKVSLNSCDFNTYIPDVVSLSEVIYDWECNQNLVFCGFIHSHPAQKQVLSKNDIQYALQVLGTYTELDYLLMGIIGENHSFPLKMYQVSRTGLCQAIDIEEKSN